MILKLKFEEKTDGKWLYAIILYNHILGIFVGRNRFSENIKPREISWIELNNRLYS